MFSPVVQRFARTLGVVFLLLLAAGPLVAQPDSVAPLRYMIREPVTAGDKHPVLLLLHGYGGNEAYLFELASLAGEDWYVFSLRGPGMDKAGSYKWSSVDFSRGYPVTNAEEAEQSRQLVIEFIGWIKQHYPVDADKIYLAGFSQGSLVSYSVALSRPELVAGAIIMSGRLLDEAKANIAEKSQLRHLDFLVCHGVNDQVLKVQYARDAVAYLKSLGLHPKFRQYPGVGHAIPNEMKEDVKDWLSKR